jgi:transcriptional regulator with XRE-family HTH domain
MPHNSSVKQSGNTPEKAFGKALRKAREKRGLSQDGLAHRTGYSRNYVGQIERGEKNPSLRIILDLAEALEVRAASMVAYVESKRRSKSHPV